MGDGTETKDLMAQLRAEIPQEDVKQRDGPEIFDWSSGTKRSFNPKQYRQLDYIGWVTAWERVNSVDPGFEWSTALPVEQGGGFTVKGMLTILGVTREGTGWEKAKNFDADVGVMAAESTAFKRAATKFGVGIGLYDKDSPERTGGSVEASPFDAPAAPAQAPAEPVWDGEAAAAATAGQPAPPEVRNEGELPPRSKFCFAVLSSVSQELDGYGVSTDDAWDYFRAGCGGLESKTQFTANHWANIAKAIEKLQDGKYPNNTPNLAQIEAFAGRVKAGPSYLAKTGGAAPTQEEAPADDDIPF
jgi:hypothetical protein